MDLTGLAVAAVVIVAASLFAWHRKRVDGVFRPLSKERRDSGASDASPEWLTLSHLVGAAIEVPVFVQFSGQYCAQCRRNQVVFDRLTRERADCRFREFLVEDHESLVRELGIRRTPTVFLLDPAGTVVARTEGAVTLRSLGETLDELIGKTA